MSEREMQESKPHMREGIVQGDICAAAHAWQGRAIDELLKSYPKANVVTQNEELQHGKQDSGPLFVIDHKHGKITSVLNCDIVSPFKPDSDANKKSGDHVDIQRTKSQ